MNPVIIGIDPGLATCGYAVVRPGSLGEHQVLSLGVFTTKKTKNRKITAAEDNVRRGIELARMIANLSRRSRTKFGPVRALHVEAMSFPRSSSAAAKMTMCWGILIRESLLLEVPLLQASPQRVKLKIVGTIDASKKHVERVLCRRYGTKTRKLLRGIRCGLHEHAFDALAAATCLLDTKGDQP
jgi:Holliday junction resolvasome RuvABC endonuclease subunit